MSPPVRGEWIEIEIQNIKCVELKSPPVREEWIEIAKKSWIRATISKTYA